MIEVALDTDVFISALFWKGAPYQVFKKILEGAVLNFISPKILEEIKERLLYKFKVPPEKVKEYLEIIVFNSKIVYPRKKLNIVKKDPSDNKVIECATEAKASFIISGDNHLLEIKGHEEIKIISPKEFLLLI